MLSQIGCVTLPPDLLDKIYAGAPLYSEEEKLFLSYPAVGRELLANIPRLESIARMIEGQHHPSKSPISPANLTSEESRIALGSQLLKLALDFEKLVTHGLSDQATLSVLRSRLDAYNPHLLETLEKICKVEVEEGVIEVMVKDLQVGMIIDQFIWAKR
jgi:response regulator RpfG family c-di-GMP phosphodiesterase